MKYHALFFSQKLERMSQNLFSAAVVIDALSVKSYIIFHIVMIRRITTTITGENVITFVSEKCFPPVVSSPEPKAPR